MRTDRPVDEKMNGWIIGLVDEVNGWMDGWEDVCIYIYIYQHIIER